MAATASSVVTTLVAMNPKFTRALAYPSPNCGLLVTNVSPEENEPRDRSSSGFAMLGGWILLSILMSW